MKKLFILITLSTITLISYSQIANDIMVGGGVDLIKTDNTGFFNKAQIGAEVNYFLARQFTATGGFDVWSDDKVSFVIGGRWYPADHFFTRIRGLIGENDLSMGAGWSKPINENLRFEAIGDFYFKLDFSVRVGVAYVIRRKQ